jgi:anti-sigma B factor antagonist
VVGPESTDGKSPGFGLETHADGDAARVVPRGEVDLATVGLVHARLEELHAAGFRLLVLDLREIAFIDSSGIEMIVTWDSYARQNGITFGLIEGPPAIQRIFEVAGLLERLPFAPDPSTRAS